MDDSARFSFGDALEDIAAGKIYRLLESVKDTLLLPWGIEANPRCQLSEDARRRIQHAHLKGEVIRHQAYARALERHGDLADQTQIEFRQYCKENQDIASDIHGAVMQEALVVLVAAMEEYRAIGKPGLELLATMRLEVAIAVEELQLRPIDWDVLGWTVAGVGGYYSAEYEQAMTERELHWRLGNWSHREPLNGNRTLLIPESGGAPFGAGYCLVLRERKAGTSTGEKPGKRRGRASLFTAKGSIIQKFRIQCGLTQGELSEKCENISAKTLARYESSGGASLESLRDIARTFSMLLGRDVSVDELADPI
jgi:DNA-binding XRE family transcriptional regulator